MNPKFPRKLFYLFLLSIFLIKCCYCASVTTNNGAVNGQTQTWFGKQVNEFLSIPYAQPPVGDLRFKRTVAVSNWTEPIDATHLPNPCFQIFVTNTNLNTNMSEDCLYLNIWQPVSTDSSEPKAVMFFIHGGALVWGSSSEYQFQGPILSTKGDIILVTPNYRLNAFGFLYTGTEDAEGNMGIWDIIMALTWVNDNIQHFGGDPNRITIAGHSGGSQAVSALIFARQARHLYQQAIMLSSATLSAEIANKQLSKQRWLKGAQLIGCANNSDTEFNTEIIDCFTNASASELVTIAVNLEVIGYKLGLVEMLLIDGVLLKKSPKQLLQNGKYKKNLKLLFNTNEDDGQIALALFYPDYGQISPANLTYNESYAALANFSEQILSWTTVDGNEVSRLYYSQISPETQDYDFLRQTTDIALGDYIIVCPTILFAESMFKHDPNGSKVYQLYYTSKLFLSVYFCAEWMGTCHGAELAPLFGMPFIYYNTSSDAQRDESVQMIGIYSHFVKHGHPLIQNGVNLQNYYMLGNNVVKPYFQINNTLEVKNSFFGYGLKITECEYLWKKYVYVKIPN